jgi:hypothetical protein
MTTYGLDPRQLRDYVVAPTLRRLALWSESAERLVMGTAALESDGFRYLRQLGSGPALGLWQCEPATHNDIHANFLKFKPDLRAKVMMLTADGLPLVDQLVGNLFYACAICRVHYYRFPDKLPAADDVAGMAVLHKRRYNSSLGATKPGQFEERFRQVLGGLYSI